MSRERPMALPGVGATVALRNMRGREHLNGAVGTVVRHIDGSYIDAVSRRHRVKIHNAPVTVKVDVENLIPVKQRPKHSEYDSRIVSAPDHGWSATHEQQVAAARSLPSRPPVRQTRRWQMCGETYAELQASPAGRKPRRLRNLGLSMFRDESQLDQDHPSARSRKKGRLFVHTAREGFDWRVPIARYTHPNRIPHEQGGLGGPVPTRLSSTAPSKFQSQALTTSTSEYWSDFNSSVDFGRSVESWASTADTSIIHPKLKAKLLREHDDKDFWAESWSYGDDHGLSTYEEAPAEVIRSMATDSRDLAIAKDSETAAVRRLAESLHSVSNAESSRSVSSGKAEDDPAKLLTEIEGANPLEAKQAISLPSLYQVKLDVAVLDNDANQDFKNVAKLEPRMEPTSRQDGRNMEKLQAHMQVRHQATDEEALEVLEAAHLMQSVEPKSQDEDFKDIEAFEALGVPEAPFGRTLSAFEADLAFVQDDEIYAVRESDEELLSRAGSPPALLKAESPSGLSGSPSPDLPTNSATSATSESGSGTKEADEGELV